MDEREIDEKPPANAEKQELNDENSQNVAAVAAAGIPSNDQQPAAVLKILIDDCFEKVFEFMSIADLLTLGETCKQLHEKAGKCFARRYSNTQFTSDGRGITRYIEEQYRDVSHMAEFIHSVQIYERIGLENVLRIQTKFRELTNVKFKCVTLSQADIDRMTGILSKLEVLDMNLSYFDGNYDDFIGHCAKLRCLKLALGRLDRIETNINWHIREYPTLESFKLVPWPADRGEGFTRILELNPNIRKFTTTEECLWEYRNELKTANTVKLDKLTISFHHSSEHADFASFCELFNELHELGVYKRLQLDFINIFQKMIDQMNKVNGLVKVSIYHPTSPLNFTQLKNLEELRLNDSKYLSDAVKVANSLTNLKRLHFTIGQSDQIVPFIKQTATLEEIKVNGFMNGIHFNTATNTIDLLAMNKLRKSLPNAQKITLYTDEKFYVAAKGTFKQTDSASIKLKIMAENNFFD